MERFEWVVSLTIFPILVFIEVSLTNYIYNGETNFIQVLTDMKDELPNYISTSLIGYVFYLFNLRSIKSLHRDVKTNYSLITLNPLRSWKKIEI